MAFRLIIALWEKDINLNMVNFEMLFISFIVRPIFLYQGALSLLLKGLV